MGITLVISRCLMERMTMKTYPVFILYLRKSVRISHCVPPTRLACPASKATQNDSKVVHEAGIPAIGGSCLPMKQKRIITDPPTSITGVLPKPLGKARAEQWDQPALSGASEWVMESGIHDSEMCRLYVKGKALQPHEWSLDHIAAMFHIDEYVKSLPGLPKNLVACHDNPDWMTEVIKNFNVNPSGIPLNLQLEGLHLRANEIALLKGGTMSHFRVHDDLLPLVWENPFYTPPSVGEPMDQDEPVPEHTPSQPTAGSSSLADRLDYGEEGSSPAPQLMSMTSGNALAI
ncbi:hypothetical protein M422DRAFT_269812 [Sphaerobolus stellatus SS14]|uniref:Uncharacterized protein n=1 Tax=Sphaerobolus stellatus (strain SS14) TaxID=990650 RepID=A0A0C9UIU7_SPHS4|nr:hypothetical protein M422DRAFT_269812 [Sphaerobolus stellatus SS14]